jgi:hypothetical protein
MFILNSKKEDRLALGEYTTQKGVANNFLIRNSPQYKRLISLQKAI